MSAPITFELPRSIITTDQAERITELASSLDHEQAVWLSGYFAGLSHQARAAVLAPAHDAGAPPPAVASATRTLTVLFGSRDREQQGARRPRWAPPPRRMASRRGSSTWRDYKPRALKEEQDLLFIASTHGEGDPPETALDFFEFLEGRKAPKLPDAALRRPRARRLDVRALLRRRPAGGRAASRSSARQRLADPVECDVDYEDAAARGSRSVVAGLVAQSENAPPACPAARRQRRYAARHAYDKRQSRSRRRCIENIVLDRPRLEQGDPPRRAVARGLAA